MLRSRRRERRRAALRRTARGASILEQREDLRRRGSRTLTATTCALVVLACAGARPADLGVRNATLGGCPASPNCVSSEARDASHRVRPFELAAPAPEAWRAARDAVAGLPRTTIVTEAPDYLHAECASAVFGFVDDLELQLRPARGAIAVRSASRVGYGDLGVNRRRVEALRSRLVRRGVVR